MGTIIKTRTITESQLNALELCAFSIDAVDRADAMLEWAREQYAYARDYLALCNRDLKQAMRDLPKALNDANSKFELEVQDIEEKIILANKLIDLYFVPDVNGIRLKTNVIVRR